MKLKNCINNQTTKGAATPLALQQTVPFKGIRQQVKNNPPLLSAQGWIIFFADLTAS